MRLLLREADLAFNRLFNQQVAAQGFLQHCQHQARIRGCFIAECLHRIPEGPCSHRIAQGLHLGDELCAVFRLLAHFPGGGCKG